MIEQIRGREISRFFWGSLNLENGQTPPHTHSIFALNTLEYFYIADIKQDLFFPFVEKPNLTIKIDYNS